MGGVPLSDACVWEHAVSQRVDSCDLVLLRIVRTAVSSLAFCFVTVRAERRCEITRIISNTITTAMGAKMIGQPLRIVSVPSPAFILGEK